MIEKLTEITETVNGYEVKELKYNPLDNIIVGMVKVPFANPKVFDGYECVQYRTNGKPTNRNKGRQDLILKMPI